MDFKNGRLIEIVREFLKENTTRYEINGIDKNSAIFFYRTPTSKFEVLEKGNYRFEREDNNDYIVIDKMINDNVFEYQIAYDVELRASTYDVSYPELLPFVEKYNELIGDIKKIVNFLKNGNMSADSKKMSKVLPTLQANMFWATNKDGVVEAIPLGDLNTKYNQMIEDIRASVKTDAEQKKKEIKDLTKEEVKKIGTLRPQITREIEQGVTLISQERQNALNSVSGGIRSIDQKKVQSLQEIDTKRAKSIEEVAEKKKEIDNNLASTERKITELGNQVSNVNAEVDRKKNAILQEIESKKTNSVSAVERKKTECISSVNAEAEKRKREIKQTNNNVVYSDNFKNGSRSSVAFSESGAKKLYDNLKAGTQASETKLNTALGELKTEDGKIVKRIETLENKTSNVDTTLKPKIGELETEITNLKAQATDTKAGLITQNKVRELARGAVVIPNASGSTKGIINEDRVKELARSAVTIPSVEKATHTDIDNILNRRW